jgi:uncharacterized membrane protein YecN with MAPEG domain
MILHVSAFYAALTGILCVILSVMVVRMRVARKISIGDGGDKEMSRMVRVFGNFAEYAPLVILVMAITETERALAPIYLHIFGAVFILGRIAHAVGLYRTLGINAGRTIGVVATLGVILALSIALLRASWSSVF